MTGASLSYPFDRSWSISAAAQFACVLEATAPKVGNVHPGASFSDMTYGDFLKSALAIAPVFEKTPSLTVGELVLESVLATRADVGINTNLGTVLLFAPIAKAWTPGTTHGDLRTATVRVLQTLSVNDSKSVYEAIRIAKPGGLGEASEHDVRAEPPSDLLIAMRHAAARDSVAAQYANGYRDLFDRLLPWFAESLHSGLDVFEATCAVQIRWLAEEWDGLIVRKCGEKIASTVQSLSRRVMAAEDVPRRRARVTELDDYLRGDGHRRNPGTTADLIAAMLFVKLLCSV